MNAKLLKFTSASKSLQPNFNNSEFTNTGYIDIPSIGYIEFNDHWAQNLPTNIRNHVINSNGWSILMTFEERLRKLIKHGEGCVSHMYLDTVGKVTVGVGNMLPDSQSAIELPFINRESGDAATDSEIVSDFDAVSAQEKAQLAYKYKQFSKLELPDNETDKLLDRRIVGFEIQLKRDFPDYENYPDDVKLGLMDMAFNLGNSGLVNKFPTFTRAVREQNWEVCANECHRNGIADSRNQEVEELFRSVLA